MSRRQTVVTLGRLGAAVLAAAVLAPPVRAQTPRVGPGAKDKPKQGMRLVRTKYYDMVTDLDEDTTREAAARMTAMGDEYARRIRGFGAKVTRRLPFYLFSKKEDYHQAGGPENSWGIYTGRRLMATASTRSTNRTWYMIQHEGFHQFLDAAMRSRIPPWLNEGLAEYFAHGIWTGDGFVMGAVPTFRCLRVKAQVRLGRMLDLPDMLNMTDATWAEQMSTRNYDQAWSLVHFLIHGEDGAYHKAFGWFLTDLGAGRPWGAAFVKRFGRDTGALQKRYEEWWLSRPLKPTPEVYATAVVQTLTSFLARAVARRERMRDFDDFRAKASAGELACRPEQWLPPKLLEEALTVSRRYAHWQLKRTGPYPTLVLTDDDGNVYTGRFTVRRGRAADVTVTMKPGRKKAAAGSR